MAAPPRVLIVDDEVSLLLTLAANLELDGLEVSTADGGAQALELVKHQPFDVMLSDVRMPGMNGVELFREVRKLRPNLPVILMTAYSVESLLDEAIREGAFAVLPKPFDLDRLPILLTGAARAPAILVVDAAPAEAEATADALRRVGLRALALSDEAGALRALAGDAIDVCVLELGVAGAGDPPLIERLRALDPSLSFIIAAGHAAPELTPKVVAAGPVNWVLKPLLPETLVRAVANARGRAAPKR